MFGISWKCTSFQTFLLSKDIKPWIKGLPNYRLTWLPMVWSLSASSSRNIFLFPWLRLFFLWEHASFPWLDSFIGPDPLGQKKKKKKGKKRKRASISTIYSTYLLNYLKNKLHLIHFSENHIQSPVPLYTFWIKFYFFYLFIFTFMQHREGFHGITGGKTPSLDNGKLRCHNSKIP